VAVSSGVPAGGLIVERSPDGAIFDLSHRGVEIARCFLAITPASEQRLWGEASAYPTLPGVQLTKPVAPPWLAVGLLPDGMVLLEAQPDLMLELGDFERCVAWALVGLPMRASTATRSSPLSSCGRFADPKNGSKIT
jgi:hypothetical protein